MKDHPGPWRRDAIDQVLERARELGEVETVLRALLGDADDAQLQLLMLSLTAAARRRDAEYVRRREEASAPAWRPPAP